MTMIERVARAIALRNGDDYDAVPLHKSDWTRQGGMFGGRFRDVNEPFQSDYDDMARAAIEAMRAPTEGMVSAVVDEGDCYLSFQQMIDAALSEQPE